LIEADLTLMPFPLLHPESDEAAGHAMQPGALGSCLTAVQPELVLASADPFPDLGAKRVQPAYFSAHQEQVVQTFDVHNIRDRGYRGFHPLLTIVASTRCAATKSGAKHWETTVSNRVIISVTLVTG
jgi:hypothetical protein